MTTSVNEDGNWEVKAIREGIPNNTKIGLVIEASNGRQEFSFYKIGPVDEEHEFTDNQQYGFCDEGDPYDVFGGTATPGATIWVESDYGRGTTTANDDGVWEIQVFFVEAPLNDAFNVCVGTEGAETKAFSFTRLEEGEGEGSGEGESEGT